MSIDAFTDSGAISRHDTHVTKAVHHRGFLPVLRVAIAAWWTRPRIPAGLSARQRADMGLPPAPRSVFWPDQDGHSPMPPLLWRLGP
ncbi:MAG: hypothetical protein P0Y65_13205 [Candidatus Devosia phytovorans]|uniref:Uncharacterized protein n=1 Tax=Candidatus Devosia phytovorans TaxID=3121372 RepID=A0AAJ6B061_9HYPH|nr:hypothetical protein [Devosia sp.]WEK03158.1 MAG: hypothetical protein P0Y65_13205 [Devosia sp.]